MKFFERISRQVILRPDLNMAIQTRDVLTLQPDGRVMDMVSLSSEASFPSPTDVWYWAQYRKKQTGQILWKKAHAHVS